MTPDPDGLAMLRLAMDWPSLSLRCAHYCADGSAWHDVTMDGTWLLTVNEATRRPGWRFLVLAQRERGRYRLIARGDILADVVNRAAKALLPDD